MNGRLGLTLGLILVSVATSVNMAAQALNYMEFFPAMRDITLRLVSIQVGLFDNETRASVHATFELENPSRYTGISVTSYGASLLFANSSGRIINGGGLQMTGFKGQFGPGSRVEATLDSVIGGDPGIQLADDTKKGEPVTFVLTVSVNVSTFLDALTLAGLTVGFQCETSGQPVVCPVSSPSVITRPFGGGGGGGGV